jgi:hypothetical protein
MASRCRLQMRDSILLVGFGPGRGPQASDLLSRTETSPGDQRQIRAAKKLKSLRALSQRPDEQSLANVLMAALYSGRPDPSLTLRSAESAQVTFKFRATPRQLSIL